MGRFAIYLRHNAICSIDLGELCTPFRYSYPPGCINSLVLNTNDEKSEKNHNSSQEHSAFENKQDLDNGTSSNTDDDININISNLTMPLCIYR